MYLCQQGTGISAVMGIWHGCKTSEEKKSFQSNLLDAEWPLNEFKLRERHFPSLGISHPVPSGARAAVGVQLGFLLLVSMFSTERGFLKGPSVQQMLCSDLPRERGACWEWWDLIPSWGPGSHCLAVMLKLLGGAPVVLFPCLVPSWVFEITLSSSLRI